MNRKTKLLLNSGMGIIKQLVILACGFILPRYILLCYGSEVNGLISSITHFLGFISLLEMGIGPVIQANLYKPLADKDTAGISKIVISSERFFRRIGYIFIGYIVFLSVLFPITINSDFEPVFTISLLLIISISSFAQYFLGATYQLLLNADQKSYVQMSLHVVTTILNTVASVVLMMCGCSVHVVKLVTAIFFVLRPLGQMVYVRKRYSIDRKIKFEGEPIKQKWNGFAQHIASVVCNNIDVFVLTVFSTLQNISIYSVYFLVVSGINSMIMTAATGLESYFGNMIAKNEEKELNQSFSLIEFIVHFFVSVVFTIAIITIIPFIKVYTNGITDADYIQPVFSAILVLAFAVQCLRIPYFRIIKAAGHFKETQNGAYISTVINIVLTLVLVFIIGLPGVAIGTFAAFAYHTVYFAVYLRKNILKRSFVYFIKYIFTDSVILVLACLATQWFEMTDITYFAWVVLALKVSFVTLTIAVIVNLIFNGKYIKKLIKKFRKKA